MTELDQHLNSCYHLAEIPGQFQVRFSAEQEVQSMFIETYSKGKYQVLRLKDEKERISDLSELNDLVNGYVNRGKLNIAVSFSDASYIYSGAIAVLIKCHQLISSKGGSLCIIEPNPSLFDVLETLNIGRVINIFVSEDFLPS